jgi:hypothetical protein
MEQPMMLSATLTGLSGTPAVTQARGARAADKSKKQSLI